MGINSYHSIYAPTQGSAAVSEFMAKGTKPLLGSEMVVELDPKVLASRIIENLKDKRKALKWKTMEN